MASKPLPVQEESGVDADASAPDIKRGSQNDSGAAIGVIPNARTWPLAWVDASVQEIVVGAETSGGVLRDETAATAATPLLSLRLGPQIDKCVRRVVRRRCLPEECVEDRGFGGEAGELILSMRKAFPSLARTVWGDRAGFEAAVEQERAAQTRLAYSPASSLSLSRDEGPVVLGALKPSWRGNWMAFCTYFEVAAIMHGGNDTSGRQAEATKTEGGEVCSDNEVELYFVQGDRAQDFGHVQGLSLGGRRCA